MVGRSFLFKYQLLLKVMNVLNPLVLNFQKETVNYGVVESQVDAATYQLTLLRRNFEDAKQREIALSTGKFPLKFSNEGYDYDKLCELKEKFLIALVNNIKSRFRNMPLISAFQFLNVEHYRSVSTRNRHEYEDFISKYGNDHMQTICEHYSRFMKNVNNVIIKPWIDEKGIMNEWPQVKAILIKSYSNLGNEEAWRAFLLENADLYPNTSRLVRLLLNLPVSTVACERGFSLFKFIKSRSRNRLSGENSDTLLRLSSEVDDPKNFDFAKALLSWKQRKERRGFSS
jgi:hypothetical protein